MLLQISVFNPLFSTHLVDFQWTECTGADSRIKHFCSFLKTCTTPMDILKRIQLTVLGTLSVDKEGTEIEIFTKIVV